MTILILFRHIITEFDEFTDAIIFGLRFLIQITRFIYLVFYMACKTTVLRENVQIIKGPSSMDSSSFNEQNLQFTRQLTAVSVELPTSSHNRTNTFADKYGDRHLTSEGS